MKEITEKIKSEIRKSHAGGFNSKVKWDSIYDSEEELIQDMFHEKIIVDGNAPVYKLCKGYEYIASFRKYYTEKGFLTEGQMKQLKRLAAEIAYHIYL